METKSNMFILFYIFLIKLPVQKEIHPSGSQKQNREETNYRSTNKQINHDSK